MRAIFQKLLQRAVQKDASDIHLKVGNVPWLRIDGVMMPQEGQPFTSEMIDAILGIMLSAEQFKHFRKRGEVDLSYTEKGVGRFRVNVYRQRGSISCVMRRIKTVMQSFEQLHLPDALQRFAMVQRGLVLITGTTGSGKTTTLASIVDYINRKRRCHIVTIEDPIEYLHNDKRAIVSQREIAMDTVDFTSALTSVMRQDPDVILVGEMRDLETFQAALSAAETGHLVFTTLHTTNVMQTIDRIIDLFPPNQHDQIRSQLSLNLHGIMCMRLLPRADGTGRVPACELLVANPAAKKLIKENRILQLDSVIASGKEEGMLSFNDSLHLLITQGLVEKEVAMEVSENP
ncbi:MAG: PilT/PilU family type 4a pilus ATPase, partial [Candidatus Hydrogenedentes bacterium]|nr:PilT/PilU family type 4a pilus ATPase [Candidatus Hydrogenedentota bacterium]